MRGRRTLYRTKTNGHTTPRQANPFTWVSDPHKDTAVAPEPAQRPLLCRACQAPLLPAVTIRTRRFIRVNAGGPCAGHEHVCHVRIGRSINRNPGRHRLA